MDTLDYFMEAASVPANPRDPLDDPPCWLDKQRFRRGQQFAQRHLASLFLANFFVTITDIVWSPIFRVMVFCNDYSDLKDMSGRMASVANHLCMWYHGDLWDHTDEACRSMREVVQLHKERIQLTNDNKEQVDAARLDTSAVPEIRCGFWPYIQQDMSSSHPPIKWPEHHCPMSQLDYSMVLLSLPSLLLASPERWGVHGATDSELSDFLYVWRVIGYHMGVEDRFNPLSGSMEVIRDLSREHRERVMIGGMSRWGEDSEYFWRIKLKTLGGVSIVASILTSQSEAFLFYMAWCVGSLHKLKTTYAKSSWTSAVMFRLLQFVMSVACRFRVVTAALNYAVKRTLSRYQTTNKVKHS